MRTDDDRISPVAMGVFFLRSVTMKEMLNVVETESLLRSSSALIGASLSPWE